MEWIRSLLFIPANRQGLLEKIGGLPADAFALDLEDSVPRGQKDEARAMASAQLRVAGRRNCWVRVNGRGSGLFEPDVRAVVGLPRLAGLILPKIDSGAELENVAAVLSEAERLSGTQTDATKLILTLESALGVLFAYTLVCAHARIASAIFAGAEDGDLMRDLGCRWSSEGPELLYARQSVLLAMRAAEVACPLDGVFSNVRDRHGFETDTLLSARLGYRGRTVIHPDQIEPANRLYAPLAEAVDRYRRLLRAYEEALDEGKAAVEFEGKMIDEAMARNARRIISAAESFDSR